MINIRPILYIIGMLLTALSIAMLIPAIIDVYDSKTDWQGFAMSSFITAFIGIGLFLTNNIKISSLNIRQVFIITTACWIVISAFSALPFLFSDLHLSYTDSLFEAISGFTTTGSTILIGLDNMPRGILLWRSLLNFLGGIGTIVTTIIILPMLHIGGMQLFKSESSEKSSMALPRTINMFLVIGGIYSGLVLLCTLFLYIEDMTFFDAITHSMSTLSTGGFSTHDASIGYYKSNAIEYIIILFMFLGSLPFILYLYAIRGNLTPILKDSQIRWFAAIILFGTVAVALWIHLNHGFDLDSAFRLALFNITSILSTTGFASADYNAWGGFVITFVFLLSALGGCTGSTTGGIKMFRYQVIYATTKSQINLLIKPNAVFHPRFNGQAISDTIIDSAMSFVILYCASFLILTILLSLTGLDYTTSMSSSISALSNIGPALGSIAGPAGTYTTIPDTAKWLLSFGMLLGRLEIFTVIAIFSSYFWRD